MVRFSNPNKTLECEQDEESWDVTATILEEVDNNELQKLKDSTGFEDWIFHSGSKLNQEWHFYTRDIGKLYTGERVRTHNLSFCFDPYSGQAYTFQEQYGGTTGINDAEGCQALFEITSGKYIFGEGHDFWFREGGNRTGYRENYLSTGGTHFFRINLPEIANSKERASIYKSTMQSFNKDIDRIEWIMNSVSFFFVEGVPYFYFLLIRDKTYEYCRINAETDQHEVLYTCEIPEYMNVGSFCGRSKELPVFANHSKIYQLMDYKLIHELKEDKIIDERFNLHQLLKIDFESILLEEDVRTLVINLLELGLKYPQFLIEQLNIIGILSKIDDMTLWCLWLKFTMGYLKCFKARINKQLLHEVEKEQGRNRARTLSSLFMESVK